MVDQRWYDYGSSQDVDRFKYGYDRASNRIWRENTVSKSQSTPVYLDEFYSYDGLHRLKTFDRGELNATKTAITGTPVREEDWTLDPLANWSGYIQKTSGTTDLDQERTVNKVNEITDISETTGTSWVTPSFDKSGNMVVVPRPDDLANGYTCTFDAWNRLVKVEAGISTVAEYSYDGLHRRTAKATNSTLRHFYHTAQWQVLTERLDSSTSPDRQFIWGPLYIDHLILRDRDTSNPPNGTLDERLYALQDANWNVTCLIDTADDPVERYIYQPYGAVTILDGSWSTTRATSGFANPFTFTGRRYDEETGLYYYRNRYYGCHVGRFVSRDGIGYIDGWNLYAARFVMSGVDPSGLSCCADNDDIKMIQITGRFSPQESPRGVPWSNVGLHRLGQRHPVYGETRPDVTATCTECAQCEDKAWRPSACDCHATRTDAGFFQIMDKHLQQLDRFTKLTFGPSATVTGSMGSAVAAGDIRIVVDHHVLGSGDTFATALSDAQRKAQRELSRQADTLVVTGSDAF